MSARVIDLELPGDHRLRPLFDPAELGVSGFLDVKPQQRTWLLEDVLPLGIVGLLAAGGGTGKSFLTMQLAVSIATGLPFFGVPVTDPGAALIIAAEDERAELHRRLWRVVSDLKRRGAYTDRADELLRERLFVASRVGADNMLTILREGVVVRTAIGDQLILAASDIPALKLIVLDPVSRFRAGDENSNDAATRFVEAVEAIREATGSTVLLPHHVSKDGLRAGADRLAMENIRGGSALVDGVRWAGAMATLRKDAAADYGVDPEDASKYVRFDIVKSNYAAPWPGMWLERLDGGVLAPARLNLVRSEKQERRAEDRYLTVLPRLQGVIRQHADKGDPLTRNRVRALAGKPGLFGVGDQTLRGILERAIAEGAVRVVQTGSKETLAC